MTRAPILTFSCIDSKIEKNNLFYGKFHFGPFEKGQALTIANSLRRTLLSELFSLKIIAVEIEGVSHEYSTFPGVKESILDILLNFKKLIFTSRFSYQQPQFGLLQIRGPGAFSASSLKLPHSIQIINPEQHIATLSYNGFLNIKIFICQNKNFLSFLELNEQFQKISNRRTKNFKKVEKTNLLPIDNSFIPVIKVNYILKKYNLSKFEKQKEEIILEIWTNGSIHPKQAIQYSIKNLIQLLINFKENNFLKSLMVYSYPNYSDTSKNKKKIEILDIGNLDLSLRSYSCLKRTKINTIGELTQYSSNDLLLLKNFGKKSLNEVEFRLKQIGLSLKNRN
jgi:DNA-directed RNA polymerase subunit alpha